MNYINYLFHTVTPPATYHRRYDLDLPPEESMAKRVALAALPFVSLYRPLGKALSVGMGGCRTLTHLSGALQAEGKKEWSQCGLELAQASLATLAIATTLFNYGAGLYITTAADLAQGAGRTVQHVRQKEYKKAAEEAMQSAASGLYLGFIATGALEAILVSTLIQAAICAVEAHKECKEGHYIEATAKFAMGTLRLHQAKGYQTLIQRRNQLFTLQRYADLTRRAVKGREVRHLIQNPLANLSDAMEAKKVTLANQSEEFDFGSHFHGYGGALVKGENLAFRKVVIDGKEQIEFQFKVNHAFRKQLDAEMAALTKLNHKEMREVLEITGSHVKDVFVKEPHLDFFSSSFPERSIELQGLGTLTIGTDSDLPNLYDRVTVRMDANKNLYDLHEILSFTNLDCAIQQSTLAELDRLKLGHLFRTFFPREALNLERSQEFFSLSLDQLKTKMNTLTPEMEKVYNTYFHRIKEAEILPGRVRYRIEGLADEVAAHGGRVLTSAITGAYFEDEELFARVASLLSMGMISTELKDTYGLNADGLGGSYYHGGADSVYLQMLTEQNVKENLNLDNLYYSKARLLISLDVLETGTYQYPYDEWGTRIMEEEGSFWWASDAYKSRPSILEFTDQLQSEPAKKWSWEYDRHEVMAKERIDPSYFTGMILEDQHTKDDLIDYLRKHNLIHKDTSGNETVLNIALDRFFRVGTHVTEDLIA